MEIKELIQKINQKKARSAWDKGLKLYAVELVRDMDDCGIKEFDLDTVKAWNWNGAGNALRYSEGACSLVYDNDICDRLCPPSIARKHPSSPKWIEVQGRALAQAMANIRQILREAAAKEAK